MTSAGSFTIPKTLYMTGQFDKIDTDNVRTIVILTRNHYYAFNNTVNLQYAYVLPQSFNYQYLGLNLGDYSYAVRDPILIWYRLSQKKVLDKLGFWRLHQEVFSNITFIIGQVSQVLDYGSSNAMGNFIHHVLKTGIVNL
jgi:hypothetical protein